LPTFSFPSPFVFPSPLLHPLIPLLLPAALLTGTSSALDLLQAVVDIAAAGADDVDDEGTCAVVAAPEEGVAMDSTSESRPTDDWVDCTDDMEDPLPKEDPVDPDDDVGMLPPT
jgi:hypothetical protein